jgi:hypothetical protein
VNLREICGVRTGDVLRLAADESLWLAADISRRIRARSSEVDQGALWNQAVRSSSRGE